MRRAFIIALALFAAAAAAVGVTAAVMRTPDSSGVSRVERVSSQRWGGSCDLDACGLLGRVECHVLHGDGAVRVRRDVREEVLVEVVIHQ
jgi:hypothetical protein